MNGINEFGSGAVFQTQRDHSALGVRAGAGASARVFHTGMAVAFLATVFAGFAPTYFLRGLSDKPPLSPLLQVHGLVFTSWLFLLLAQTALVATHRVSWHRRLGIAGAMLAAVMVPLGIMTAVSGARHEIATGASAPLVFLIFPIGQMILFAAFIGAAVWKRRQPEIHRRLVLVSTALMVTPAISRLPFVPNPMVSLLLTAMFVVAGMVHDWRSRGRVHAVYILGAVVIVLSGPLRLALGHTSAWQAFARFLVQ
jgi:hypothetical protein